MKIIVDKEICSEKINLCVGKIQITIRKSVAGKEKVDAPYNKKRAVKR